MSKLPKFSRDSSYKRRGGTAKWLLLSCGACKEDFSLYQKDGPGNLHRLYLDRLFDTEGNRPFRDLGKAAISGLVCVECKELIASPMVYEKDDRPRVALRLVGVGIDQSQIKNTAELAGLTLDLHKTMQSVIEKGN